MSLDELVIAPNKEAGGKGRSFRAVKVCAVMADGLTELGAGDKHERPVYATFVASENQLKPFVANLLCGRPAIAPNSNSYRRRGEGSGYEFMKSAGYKVFWQRREAGAAATIYLPELFTRDPGMIDPKEVKFLCLPGRDYLVREAERMPVEEIVGYARRLPMVEELNTPEKDWRGHVLSGWEEPLPKGELAQMVPLSYFFALYLSNYSRAPIPPDGRFYLQLLLGCMRQGLASRSLNDYRDERRFGRNKAYGFSEEGLEEGGLSPGIAFQASHEELEGVLKAECALYYERTERR